MDNKMKEVCRTCEHFEWNKDPWKNPHCNFYNMRIDNLDIKKCGTLYHPDAYCQHPTNKPM